MKCLRCMQDKLTHNVNDRENEELEYYCETCGATYRIIDDSGV